MENKIEYEHNIMAGKLSYLRSERGAKELLKMIRMDEIIGKDQITIEKIKNYCKKNNLFKKEQFNKQEQFITCNKEILEILNSGGTE